ncbi:MAG: response regulator [Chloroflexi bacterium]|nr:response regulator [Chloroflexota bacterium]
MAHILVAEDERDIRELINFTLMFAGHKVTQASNGAEALELALQVRPDLIMMDVRMPKMTGYEACRQMKQNDDIRHIPVVFLSAKGQDEEVQTGIEAGAVAYILKPFAPEELTRRIGEILAQNGLS